MQYELIRTQQDLIKAITSLDNKLLYCDSETTADEGRTKPDGGLYGKIRLIQIKAKDTPCYLFDAFFIDINPVIHLIQSNEAVWHGADYDLHVINLTTPHTALPKVIHDTLYLSRLCWYTKQKFGLHDCLEYAELNDDFINAMDKKAMQKSDWSQALTTKHLEYAASDVFYLEKLYNKLVDYENSLVYSLDITNLRYAIHYSRNGIPTNQPLVRQKIAENIQHLEDIYKQLPESLNVRSSIQVCKYLGTSDSKAETLKISTFEGNQRAQLIIDARHCYKMMEYLQKYNRPRAKGFFNPNTALSGRWNCTGGDTYTHANLQQIPHELLECFQAPPGYKFVYKDYSGLELRTATAYCGEAVMANLMRKGMDMHAETGLYVFSMDELSKEVREMAKIINWCLIYGSGINTVQMNIYLGIAKLLEYKQVKNIINKWFQMYPAFYEMNTTHKYQLDVMGYVDIETALGRRIRTYKLTDSLNFPIQGTACEVTKTSIALLFKRRPELKSNNFFADTIHDANLLCVPEDEAEDWGKELDRSMLDAWYYVIQELADPEVPMPSGYKVFDTWN